MSTEARRASLPPRPTVPPRPAHPPVPHGPGTPEADRREPAPRATPRGLTTSGSGNLDTREPVHPPSDPSNGGGTARSSGSGAFDARWPAAPPHGGADRAAAGADGRTRGLTSGGPGMFDVREPADPPAGERNAAAPAGTGAPAGPAAPRPRVPGGGAGAPAPPPPRASARFPDAPPAPGRGTPARDARPAVPPRPTHRPAARGAGAPAGPSRTAGTPSETTTRLRTVPADPAARPPGTSPRPPFPPRPAPDARAGHGEARRSGAGPAHAPDGAPDPVLSWSAPMTPGRTPRTAPRPVVSFGEPEGYDADARPRPLGRRNRSQVLAAALCLVLGTGLIGGAVAGSWLAGDPGGSRDRGGFAAAGDLWHNVPVDQLFPPTVEGRGAGPGDSDRFWTRIAVAPDSGCEAAFDALLGEVLAPVGCERLLRATYTDATQSHVTTVGLLFTRADAAATASLARRFDTERLDRRTDLMPLPYAAKGTAAAAFGTRQRASWAISVLKDAPVVVYTVSGWADGRAVDTPQPADDAMESGATTAVAQAGLGHEARGLADRVERGLRKRAGTATEHPS
ncbi:hypothetical protein ACF07S_18845 [Streptomyces sp. NPDC016640]|uniref:hypothetical protein n=1 Tax=Streptomyces sp. NPDC016640 TaxID=3364969 RepID=UPI0036F947C2